MNVHQLACPAPGPREPGLPWVRREEPAGAARAEGTLLAAGGAHADARGRWRCSW